MTEFKNRPTTVADYFAIIRRRKWAVIVPPIVAGVAAFFVSASQSPLYHASAQMLVNRTSVVSAVTQITDPSVLDAQRFLATEATIGRSPELARRVAEQIPGMTAGKVLKETSITPSSDRDLLTVGADDGRYGTAIRLANVYANQFAEYTKETRVGYIDQAVADLQTKLASLRANGQAGSVLYANLSQTASELQTVGRLLAGNTTLLRGAGDAAKVRPRPARDTVIAVAFGLMIGLALAFLAEALDRRVRNEHELDEVLQLPLLSRIPKPSRQLQKTNDLIMLEAPASAHAETYRKLRTSLQFVNPEESARTIMVTSAVSQEGKSTTIANLAVALARANRRVVLVDLDLRAPILSRLFDVPGRPGITDVAVNRATLTQAIRPIPLAPVVSPRTNGRHPATAQNGATEVDGLLHLLPAGTIPPSADEMLQNPRLLGLLDELATQFDVVLIDAPPLLAFGDAMTLSTKVDAIFAITRLGKLERSILHEFARQLQTLTAKVFGYVITGVEHTDSYRYMYDAYAYEARTRDRETKQPV
jgi:Mrp family chromosome partitioning ATPase